MGIRVLLVLIAAVWLMLVAATWSSAEAKAADGDEYNFSWLDPEKKIYVLQNRRYVKARRAQFSVMTGPGFSNAYRSTLNIDGRLSYYFSEALGLEGFYAHTMNSTNNTYENLKVSAPNARAIVREIRAEYGALVQWVPWYAKINVFNRILYFDWYFSGGAGQIKTALDQAQLDSVSANFLNQDFLALYAGTGHQYHLGRNLTVRLDLTGAFYQAPISGATGKTGWFPNYNLNIGIGLRI